MVAFAQLGFRPTAVLTAGFCCYSDVWMLGHLAAAWSCCDGVFAITTLPSPPHKLEEFNQADLGLDETVVWSSIDIRTARHFDPSVFFPLVLGPLPVCWFEDFWSA